MTEGGSEEYAPLEKLLRESHSEIIMLSIHDINSWHMPAHFSP